MLSVTTAIAQVPATVAATTTATTTTTTSTATTAVVVVVAAVAAQRSVCLFLLSERVPRSWRCCYCAVVGGVAVVVGGVISVVGVAVVAVVADAVISFIAAMYWHQITFLLKLCKRHWLMQRSGRSKDSC